MTTYVLIFWLMVRDLTTNSYEVHDRKLFRVLYDKWRIKNDLVGEKNLLLTDEVYTYRKHCV